MAGCLISFGANLGNPLETIRSASELLRRSLVTSPSDYSLSRFFRTPPVGGPTGQPPFVNAVAALHTAHTVLEVWQAIRQVEQELGRQRDRRWEARRIDLDILLYDDVRIWTSDLKIPHPRMCMRRFILVPALDVAPDWVDPVSQWSISQMAQSLQAGPGNVLLVAEETQPYQAWLAEIAQQTVAEVVPLGRTACGAPRRRISLASYAGLEEFIATEASVCNLPTGTPLSKLVMVLAPAYQPQPGVTDPLEWEARCQGLAESWRLLARPSLSPYQQQNGLAAHDSPTIGPRYLLSSDNRDWAIHEIVSALEAMDCPVEALNETN